MIYCNNEVIAITVATVYCHPDRDKLLLSHVRGVKLCYINTTNIQSNETVQSIQQFSQSGKLFVFVFCFEYEITTQTEHLYGFKRHAFESKHKEYYTDNDAQTVVYDNELCFILNLKFQ